MIKEVYKKNKGWDKKHGKMAVLICDYCGKEFKRAYGCINRKDETRRYSKNYTKLQNSKENSRNFKLQTR